MQHRDVVLVVDDDPAMLKGVQRLLRQHDYKPILFSSAEAFRNHTDFEKAVCVILDIKLNDGSGIELRHRLKADGVSVPVIYMTGNEDPAVRKAALKSGCIALSDQAIFISGVDRAAQESLAGAPTAGTRAKDCRVCLCGPVFHPLKANNAAAVRTTIKAPKPTTPAMNQRSCTTRYKISDPSVSSSDHFSQQPS